MNLVKFRANQQPVVRYKHLLSIMQQQRNPRGVWRNPIDYYTKKPMYDQPLPPVYQSGLHAFRHICSNYLKAALTPDQHKLLKGFVTRVKDVLNAVYFGRADNKFYVVISDAQEDQFARFIIRFHLIDDLDIKLVDPEWYDASVNGDSRVAILAAKSKVLDLRKVPLEVIRKLSRWKLQYSPGFDGLIQYDRVDQLITDINASSTLVSPVYNTSESTVKVERRRPVPLTSVQARMLSSAELDEFERAKYDYRRWCYFLNQLAGQSDYSSDTAVPCNLYFDMKLPVSLKEILIQYGCTIDKYSKQTFVYLPPKSRRPLVRILDAKNLSIDLLLKLANILLEITQ